MKLNLWYDQSLQNAISLQKIFIFTTELITHLLKLFYLGVLFIILIQHIRVILEALFPALLAYCFLIICCQERPVRFYASLGRILLSLIVNCLVHLWWIIIFFSVYWLKLLSFPLSCLFGFTCSLLPFLLYMSVLSGNSDDNKLSQAARIQILAGPSAVWPWPVA